MAIVSPAPLAPAPSRSVTIAALGGEARARLVLGVGLALMLAALGWLIRTEFAMPLGHPSQWWGVNPLAAYHWTLHLHAALPAPLPAARWNRDLQTGFVVAWAGYGLAALAARRAAPTLRVTLTVTASFALLVAVLAPPVLSTDAYAYAASARMAAVYGQNPYVALPYSVAQAAHDPIQFFLSWNIPTVYGPVWTGLCVALAAALPHSWMWGEVLCLKIAEGTALCCLAWGAGRIAEHAQPGRGRLAAFLVGINPLLLLEGAGSGHNDLLMMACTFMALALFLQGRHGRAGGWLGLAVGVKMLPLLLLPWLLLEMRRQIPGLSARRRAAFELVVWMGLPLIAGYACFWHGTAIWDALRGRAHIGHGTLLWAGLTYVALTAWQAKQTETPMPWLPAWAMWGVVFMVTGLGTAFPWYIAWFWPALSLRGGRLYQALWGVVFVFALFWECLYGTLLPVRAASGR